MKRVRWWCGYFNWHGMVMCWRCLGIPVIEVFPLACCYRLCLRCYCLLAFEIHLVLIPYRFVFVDLALSYRIQIILQKQDLDMDERDSSMSYAHLK